MSTSEKLRAPAWFTLAMVAGAIEPIVAKFAFRDGATALQLVVLKNCLGGLFVLVFLLGKHKNLRDLKLVRSLLLPALLLFGTNTLTLLALQSISVVLLITIVSSVPAIVALINSTLGRDRLGLRFWIGFALCFVGIIFTLDFRDAALSWIGVVFVFLAAMTSSIYRVRMEILCEEFEPKLIAAGTFFLQGLLTLTLVPFTPPLSWTTLGFGAWIGIIAAVANIAFVAALNLVGSTRISVLTMIQRPLLVIFAAVTLHESINAIQGLGIVMTMIGIHLAQVSRTQTEQRRLPAGGEA